MMNIIDRILALPAYAFITVAHWTDRRRELKHARREARRRQLRAGEETR